ncbi:hypothetical protein NZD89_27560 [Alicyclobacillus fastidiosus]|uniref:Uncharacterized protein n=1 Tax=Alicyclobacillus fastidiosus TaxID=392011 RepID=A0ABY6ZH35_9BACL|nr:hypothetical protein [Alicyclobacillus fastidiosus]WAH41913.1 hypothetical protein NZD89_27560 [Alicyclobacillus fastidiosus]GMA63628.1 hypothetical protein GCM10025859_40680 [Alicyclobacillus fastidiosus]
MSDKKEVTTSSIPIFDLLYDHLMKGDASQLAAGEVKERMEWLKNTVESEARRVFEEHGIALPNAPQQTEETEKSPQSTRNRKRLVWPRHNG